MAGRRPAGIEPRIPHDSTPFLFDPELGISANLSDDGEPVLHRLISDRKAITREAELRRLLYVALTRTADHLILTTTDAETNRLCGLPLLRPGLSLAGIDFAPVPFPRKTSAHPNYPVPRRSRLLVEPIA